MMDIFLWSQNWLALWRNKASPGSFGADRRAFQLSSHCKPPFPLPTRVGRRQSDWFSVAPATTTLMFWCIKQNIDRRCPLLPPCKLWGGPFFVLAAPAHPTFCAGILAFI